MATKIKLGARPKSFKKIVKFPLLDGTEGRIECTYKYRSRKEFSEFIDSTVDAGTAKAKADVDVQVEQKFSMAALTAKTSEANAAYLLDVLEGWDLEVELDLESAADLVDTYPAAANAIMETYRLACTEGRLGN